MYQRLPFLLVVLGVSMATIARTVAADTDTAPAYNVLLIAVDGLRADHMGVYGYKRDTTPHLDARAKQAVVFDRAVAQASWTLPSFATLFTSQYPEKHGANSYHNVIAVASRSFVQVLHDSGYRTAGFVGGHFLDPLFGFSRGFDLYRGIGWGVYGYFHQTAPLGVQWLRENKDKRFFLFVHGNDLHPPFDLPYQGEHVAHHFDPSYQGPVDSFGLDYYFVMAYNDPPNKPYENLQLVPGPDYMEKVQEIRSSPRELQHIVSHYDDEIFAVDQQIDSLFEALRETGHDRDTIVIVTADHGMEWGEKGKMATGFHETVFDTVTRVPLMIWHPGLKAMRVKGVVQLADVAPTLLEWLGLAAPGSFQGASFAALAKGAGGGKQARYAFSSSSTYGAPDLNLFSIEDSRWKLIYSKRDKRISLYDLKKDPAETKDVLSREPGLVRDLARRLSEHTGLSITP